MRADEPALLVLFAVITDPPSAGTTGVVTVHSSLAHIFDLHLRSTCRKKACSSSAAAAAAVAARLSESLIARRFQTVCLGCNYVEEEPADRLLPQLRRLQSRRMKGDDEPEFGRDVEG